MLTEESEFYKDNLKVYIDRFSDDYINAIINALKPKKLIEGAKTASECELHKKGEKRITIKFSGLSALTLIGGAENSYKELSKTSTEFLKLISDPDILNKNLKEGDERYYLDIELLLAYPYSDFVYDWVSAEITPQVGMSVGCMLNGNPYEINFQTPKKLTYKELWESYTWKNLTTTLKRLQERVIESKKFNTSESKHKFIVKFAVQNIMSCFLKINNEIFIDPYVYTKAKHDSGILSLISPVTHLILDEKTYQKTKEENEIETCNIKYSKTLVNHFFGLITHFRYLWHHPTTLICTDATYFVKGSKETLANIKTPSEIFFNTKAKAIGRRIEERETNSDKISGFKPTGYSIELKESSIDLWKQYMRNEFLRYCSKFILSQTNEIDFTLRQQIKLNPIPVFIVGAWKQNDVNNYMKVIKEFLENPIATLENIKNDVLPENFTISLDSSGISGLSCNPIIIDADDASEIRKIIYENLNLSQLGFVVQTGDITDGDDNSTNDKYSRPNVYLEKGYLLGKIGKRIDRFGKERDAVFVFKEKNTQIESDNITVSYTGFCNEREFKIELYRVAKWLWDVTDVNSEYILVILNYLKEIINAKNIIQEASIGKENQKINDSKNPDDEIRYQRHLYKVTEFIKEIQNWNTSFKSLIRHNHNL